ncbi:hypothetical protein [Kitasatospora sp. MAP5-34]|uniref:hypothetical protein n=1 Tax=Kitasatospora sp. MAP5-34 TaxID=3035102 RepID=UPI002476FA86|nr:hypothetical protein [Kitasatospora sp. MAP5-34]MDH6574446.1 hypothetical protein [Kitasatospora sp. MAP5-34]
MPKPVSPRRMAQLAALKKHVREQFDLAEDDTVLLSQLDCTEPGCPPVETVVAVLPASGGTRRWTLHHPIDEITPELLTQTLAGPPVTSEGERT